MIRKYTKGIPQKYKNYVYRAKRKNISFVFTLDEFNEITSKPCYYCGSEDKIGIDRVDSKLEYTKDNTVSCCYTCNIMKHTHSTQFFLSHIERILSYQRDKNIVNNAISVI